MSYGNSNLSDARACGPSLEDKIAAWMKANDIDEALIDAVDAIMDQHGQHILRELVLHTAYATVTSELKSRKKEVKKLLKRQKKAKK